MPYITTIKTIEKTVKYWVPQEIIDKSHTNCGDSSYSYIANIHRQDPEVHYAASSMSYLNIPAIIAASEEEIDERIIDPVFPKTVVSPGE